MPGFHLFYQLQCNPVATVLAKVLNEHVANISSLSSDYNCILVWALFIADFLVFSSNLYGLWFHWFTSVMCSHSLFSLSPTHPRNSSSFLHMIALCTKLTAIGVSVRREPPGLLCSDGKQPNGVSVVPWWSGKFLVWDATCANTFALSYRSLAVHAAGAVAARAESPKEE